MNVESSFHAWKKLHGEQFSQNRGEQAARDHAKKRQEHCHQVMPPPQRPGSTIPRDRAVPFPEAADYPLGIEGGDVGPAAGADDHRRLGDCRSG